MVLNVFQFQISKLKEHLTVSMLLIFIALTSLYIGVLHDTLKQSVAYLLCMWLFAFIIDAYALRRTATQEFSVRQPKQESLFFLMSFVLGYIFLAVRFLPSCDWPNLPGLIKLAVLPLLLFMFPIALAVYLLIKKYKLADLGFRFQGLLVVLPILVISAGVNRLVSPTSLTLDAVLVESGGWLGAIVSGFVVAALAEEFFRFVGQTRLGAYFNNTALAWFITSLLWAFMHAPKWYGDDLNLTEAIIGSLRIIPIGLMWGYLTHRTKSMIPSIILHGLNVWGLQNF